MAQLLRLAGRRNPGAPERRPRHRPGGPLLNEPSAGERTPDDLHSISRQRLFKDRAAAAGAAVCGAGIISALALMLGYLSWEAAALAWPPSAEQAENCGSLAARADMRWISPRGGKVLEMTHNSRQLQIALADWQGAPRQQLDWQQLKRFDVRGLWPNLAGGNATLALDNSGQALLFEPEFRLQWREGITDYHDVEVSARVQYPLGETPLRTGLPATLDTGPSALPDRAAFRMDERQALLLATKEDRLYLVRWSLGQALFGEGRRVLDRQIFSRRPAFTPIRLLLGADNLVYAIGTRGQLELYRLQGNSLQLLDSVRLLAGGRSLNTAALLLGGRSLVVADERGGLSLWRAMRNDAGGYGIARIRRYEAAPAGVSRILPEPNRKGFYAFDASGGLRHYYIGETSAQLSARVSDQPVWQAWLGPAGRQLVVQSGGAVSCWQLDNEYADVSTALLWQPQWYEGYPEPEWIWQSTSADQDFEPKFSLLPLVMGTLKGAFYALLFAVPVSLLAAIYVARFMSAAARAWIKPTIEMMAALPTVILGFLAALWLAPLARDYLAGILLGTALLPLALALFGVLVQRFPAVLRRVAPEGWEFVPAIGVCALAFGIGVMASPLLNTLLFGGDFIYWMDEVLGIDYQQRNAAIIGLAMGFAVIPTIFSISEDALYEAPKSLFEGALALGATRWAAVMRIIIPTASPGIFSALMIGLGRAVGETMVVVMATGNTPLLDWSPFVGMRTLSANIAVEMPEAEIGSSHFHLLFLSAGLLFLMTFATNSAAEYIRHRLRARYSNL